MSKRLNLLPRTGKSLDASVVIPTYNRSEILSRVLGYYCCQLNLQGKFELIVIDDGSEDTTCSLFDDLKDYSPRLPILYEKRYQSRIITSKAGEYEALISEKIFLPHVAVPLKYIKIKKSGRSVARNIGILFASYPLIIFADDDIFVESEFVAKHMGAHYFDDRRVVMGKVIHTSYIEEPFSARWKLRDMNTAFLSTGNASLFREYIIKAGGFDEHYSIYGWEDFDLGVHLKDMGIKSVRRSIYGYHYDLPNDTIDYSALYQKERERGITAVYFYIQHPLPWVRRFTLVRNNSLRGLFRLLGKNNWFLQKKGWRVLKGLFKLIVRYKGYFDGIEEGKQKYGISH